MKIKFFENQEIVKMFDKFLGFAILTVAKTTRPVSVRNTASF